jgi:hypothetical protein
MGFDPQPRKLWRELETLSPRGRARTERTLRKIYLGANEALRGETARFLYTWKSARRFDVAADWMAAGPDENAFHWILECYCLAPGWTKYDRILALFEAPNLSDNNVDDLIDQFGSCAQFSRGARRRKAIEIVASFHDHRSPAVRWTTAFRLATLGATEYRHLLVEMTGDDAKCNYGTVSAVARRALLRLDGETVDVGRYDEP